MWIKSIYGKAAFKRLKLYICRAGMVTATCECQWPCGLQRVVARDFRLGCVLAWRWGAALWDRAQVPPHVPF